MYENEKKGISIIVFIIILVIFIVITLLATFFITSNFYQSKINKYNEEYKQNINQANMKIDEANKKIEAVNDKILDINNSVKKIDEKKDIIYSSKETVKGKVLNKPNINIDSRDVAKLNSQINKFYEEYKVNLNNNIVSGTLNYTTYKCDNIVAVIIKEQVSGKPIKYSVYNFNIKTGKNITNGEILEMKKVTRQTVFEKISAKFDSEDYLSKTEKSYNKDMIQNRICVSNVDLPMYLDENGRINIILLEQSTKSKYGFTNTIYTLDI